MMEENAKLKEQLNGLEEKLKSSMDLQKQLDALTQEKDAALSNTAKLKEALQLAEDARNEASSKLEEASQKNANLALQIQDLEGKLDSAKVEAASSKMEETTARNAELAEQISILKHEKGELEVVVERARSVAMQHKEARDASQLERDSARRELVALRREFETLQQRKEKQHSSEENVRIELGAKVDKRRRGIENCRKQSQNWRSVSHQSQLQRNLFSGSAQKSKSAFLYWRIQPRRRGRVPSLPPLQRHQREGPRGYWK